MLRPPRDRALGACARQWCSQLQISFGKPTINSRGKIFAGIGVQIQRLCGNNVHASQTVERLERGKEKAGGLSVRILLQPLLDPGPTICKCPI